MKKIILTILICSVIAIGITGCNENKNDEHSFIGKIIESNKSYIIVEPNENEEERDNSDKFRIDLKNNNITYEVGTSVKITYIGGINKSYPVQIYAKKIELINEINITIMNDNKIITINDNDEINKIYTILNNLKYDSDLCKGINTYKITINDEAYYLKGDCQEVQKGNKQSKISKEDLNTIIKIIDNNK